MKIHRAINYFGFHPPPTSDQVPYGGRLLSHDTALLFIQGYPKIQCIIVLLMYCPTLLDSTPNITRFSTILLLATAQQNLCGYQAVHLSLNNSSTTIQLTDLLFSCCVHYLPCDLLYINIVPTTHLRVMYSLC